MLLLAAVSHANLAASRPNPAVGGSLFTAGTHLAVDAEVLTLDCGEAADEVRCDFVARYAVRNPTDSPQRAVVAFVGERVATVGLFVDGAQRDRELAAEEFDALLLVPGVRRRVQRRGAELELAPGATATLEARGALTPGRFFQPSYEQPPLSTRHPVLGTRQHRSTRFDLEYVIAPLRSWSGEALPRVAVTLRTPEAWSTSVLQRRAGSRLGVASEETQDAGARVTRFELDGSTADELEFVFTLPPSTVLHGGPFVAAGGTFGPGGGFRARLGYEGATPSWLIWSFSADTDFQRLLQLALVAEAATNAVLVLPSLSAGAGAVVRVLPEAQPGVRAQVALQWPFFGVVTSVDFFPSARDVVQVSLLGRLSL